MTPECIQEYLAYLKLKNGGVRMYTPTKYFQGLKTKKEIRTRFEEMLASKRSPGYADNRYTTDKLRHGSAITTPPSSYTLLFQQRYGSGHRSLKAKSRVSGVPEGVLKEVWSRGLAAWKTGHRVGVTPQQWGYARVHSFIVFGCTLFGPDFDLFRRTVSEMSRSSFREWVRTNPVSCPRERFASTVYFRTRLATNYREVIRLRKRSDDE